MFTSDEKNLILATKLKIKEKLENFSLTYGKVRKTPEYYISGGCIASYLQGDEPNDYDIYFYSAESAKEIVRLYTSDPAYMNEVATYLERYRDSVVETNVSDSETSKHVITENAITLKNGLQLITKHYGTPDDIRNTFDYVHCLPYYDAMTDRFIISREQFDCCINKKLKINNPQSVTHKRLGKFISRGYTE